MHARIFRYQSVWVFKHLRIWIWKKVPIIVDLVSDTFDSSEIKVQAPQCDKCFVFFFFFLASNTLNFFLSMRLSIESLKSWKAARRPTKENNAGPPTCSFWSSKRLHFHGTRVTLDLVGPFVLATALFLMLSVWIFGLSEAPSLESRPSLKCAF